MTYHRDIRALVETNCVSCHTEGGIAPFTLESWEDVEPRAPLMAAAVAARRMPPWPAADDCHDLRDVGTLNDDERALFEAWKVGGFAQGDEADYVPPMPVSAPGEIDLDAPDLIRQPAVSYTINQAISDEYRCFLVPEAFEQDTYVTAMDIRPGNRTLVHHVQVHTIPASSLSEAERLDAAAAGPGWQCAGSTVTGSFNMFSWRPGTQALRFDQGDAALIDAGTRLVLQVHYHPHSEAVGDSDLSQVALWTLPEGEVPEYVVRRSSMYSYPLNIPAGDPETVSETTESIESIATVGRASFGTSGNFIPGGEIVGMTPHMHMLGSRFSVTLKRAGGEDSCLVDIPRWDFEWQLDYLYPSSARIAYEPGDTITLRCQYDNSPENQAIVDGERRVSRNVTWGEGTFDEMCLNYVWLRYSRESYLAAVAR